MENAIKKISLATRFRKMVGLGRRDPRSRMDMSLEHQLDLFDRYPRLYRLARRPHRLPAHSMSNYGICCGDGWFGIIGRLSADFSSHSDRYVVQVKEKFGELRFYTESDRDSRAALPTDLAVAINRARDISVVTCEICGEAGTLAERRSKWLSVRCRSCEVLDRMQEACRELQRRRTDLGSVLLDPILLDSMRLGLLKLGQGTRELRDDQSSLFTRAAWKRLKVVEDLDSVLRLSADKIVAFVREVVPSLERSLR